MGDVMPSGDESTQILRTHFIWVSKLAIFFSVFFWIIGVMNSWGGTEIYLFSAIIIMPIFLIVAAVAIAVLCFRGFRTARIMKWSVLRALIFAISSSALFIGIGVIASRIAPKNIGVYLKLRLNEKIYLQIIQQENSLKNITARYAHRNQNGLEYIVDFQRPMKFIFNYHGFLSNRWGILYDPSDSVGKFGESTLASQTISVRHAVSKYFGGSIYSCHLIKGHFYDCSFTLSDHSQQLIEKK
jgi:hypothetical protein